MPVVPYATRAFPSCQFMTWAIATIPILHVMKVHGDLLGVDAWNDRSTLKQSWGLSKVKSLPRALQVLLRCKILHNGSFDFDGNTPVLAIACSFSLSSSFV